MSPERRLLDEIAAVAEAAGEIALGHFRRLGQLAVEAKGPLDLVTRADREVEDFLRAELTRRFPADGVFGEEGTAIRGDAGRIWVLDPIDGTFNFVRGSDQWAISIGLFERGAPGLGVLHAPVRRETLIGCRGQGAWLNGRRLPPLGAVRPAQACVAFGFNSTTPVAQQVGVVRALVEDLRVAYRCNGSAALSCMMVAKGEVDAYLGLGEASWDIMAGLPICEALGAESSIDWPGVALTAKHDFACGAPALMDPLRRLLAGLPGSA